MVQMLPTYTLERLQNTDIDLLLPLYDWYCKEMGESSPQKSDGNIVYRDGKKYRKIDPKNADWLRK